MLRPDDSAIISRLNNVIFESSYFPFAVSHYVSSEKVTDFVNRHEEISKFKDQIHIILSEKISRSIRLDGPAGVGKSTLFNHIKKVIEIERSDPTQPIQYLTENTDILTSYLDTPGIIKNFRDIWRSLLTGLEAGFDEELHKDISLPEYIMLRFIFRLHKLYPNKIDPLIWKNQAPPDDPRFAKFEDIIDPVLNRGGGAVTDFKNFYSEYKRDIRTQFKTELDGVSFEIKKDDTDKILNLFHMLDEDDELFSKIKTADPSLFPNPVALIDFFNDLIRFYACAIQKRPLLLLGIDEVAKFQFIENGNYYQNLGDLFVQLRNKLNYVLFVFISTTEDWAKFDTEIKLNSNLNGQISDYLYKMPLKQLGIAEMVEVFKNRIDGFWKFNSNQADINYKYYPFSEKFFEYIYRYKRRDLRQSMIFLDDIWTNFRNKHKIPELNTYFKSMSFVRSIDQKSLEPNELETFEWKIIHDVFLTGRFDNNTARSSAIETGLELAFKSIQRDQLLDITKVENNPNIQTSNGNRRPDIYIELRGNLGAEQRRNIEFQVKAYKPEKVVEPKSIESSLELFNENYTDMIYFIITGKGLSNEAEYTVKKLENEFTNRIRRPKLSERQIDYLYYLALFEEISGNSIEKVDINFAKQALSEILGQDVNAFLSEIKQLSYRKALIDETPTPLPIKPTPKIDDFIPKGETPEKEESQSQVTEKTEPDWLKNNLYLEKYKQEFLALCFYLKDREKGTSKFKFTESNALKNAIIQNAAVDKTYFKELITAMKNEKLIEPVKKSFKLTKTGEDLYWIVKNNGYK